MKLAPYVRRHHYPERAAAGFGPANFVGILIGWPGKKVPAGWKYASWRCVIPDNAPPTDYDWRWCAGFDVMVYETFSVKSSPERILEALRAIDPFARDGCLACRVPTPDSLRWRQLRLPWTLVARVLPLPRCHRVR